jgi:tetratricopeptide (TPR) repeat protein
MSDLLSDPQLAAPPRRRAVPSLNFSISDTFAKALACHRQGHIDEAIRHYQAILAFDPDHGAALTNLGVILKARHDYGAAIALYSRALALKPESSSILGNLGNALLMAGRPEEALACQERFLAQQPESPEGYFNKGLCLRALGRLGDAIFSFDRALALCHDYVEAEWDRGLTLLMAGEYYDGFAAYESRWRLPETRRPRLKQPTWTGTDPRGKTLLLYTEQGFGDTLHFLRYARYLQEHLGARVLLHCQKELVNLLRQQNVFTAVNAYKDPVPPHDVHAPLLSVPWLAGLTETCLGEMVPYLRATTPVDLPFFSLAAAKKRVGIVWAGRPTHRNDRNRSAGLEHFLPLLAMPDIRLFSLQNGPRSEDLRKYGVAGAIFDLSESMQDFADTVGLIDNLDLVITVDTAVAHLAGSMGKPVWVLLPFMGDWRWGITGDRTPWYPAMRLFRQTRLGEWQDVFDAVMTALGDL